MLSATDEEQHTDFGKLNACARVKIPKIPKYIFFVVEKTAVTLLDFVCKHDMLFVITHTVLFFYLSGFLLLYYSWLGWNPERCPLGLPMEPREPLEITILDHL